MTHLMNNGHIYVIVSSYIGLQGQNDCPDIGICKSNSPGFSMVERIYLFENMAILQGPNAEVKVQL